MPASATASDLPRKPAKPVQKRKWRSLLAAAMIAVPGMAQSSSDLVDDYLFNYSFDTLSAETELQIGLDAVTNPAERADQMQSIVTAWQDARAEPQLWLSLTKVMCRVAPFALPTATAEDETRSAMTKAFSSLWSRYHRQQAQLAYDAARYTDCALANVGTGYFAASRTLKDTLPSQSCSTANAHDMTDLRAQFTQIADNAPRGSYYRLRSMENANRLRISAAFGQMRDGQATWPEIMAEIAATGDAYTNAAIRSNFDDMRNSWRHLNDFRFHGALYTLVGSAPGSDARIDAMNALLGMRDLTPVLGSTKAMAPWVAQDIARTAPDYIDPVRITHLFPGHAAPDCTPARNLTLELSDLAKGALSCLRVAEPYASHQDFTAYASCLNRIDSPVWWLQLGAYRSNENAFNAARSLQGRYGSAEIEIVVLPPDHSSDFYRIRTQATLLRAHADQLAARIKADDREVLLGRAKVY